MTGTPHEPPYSRTGYRAVIAWRQRLQREAGFLDAMLADAPVRRVLDVGCGSGEHTRHLAERGWQAVGIDVSEAMLEEAAALAGAVDGGGSARFEQRDVVDAGGLPEVPFGAALCVGNTLAFAESRDVLAAMFGGVAAALAPGAPFLVQMLNYERILSVPVRALPVNVRPLPEGEGQGELVFLRILSPRPDGDVDFHPITLVLRPGEDEPVVEVRSVKRYVHHAWKRAELLPALDAAGFDDVRVFGAMAETPFGPDSSDLVLAARRRRG